MQAVVVTERPVDFGIITSGQAAIIEAGEGIS